MKDSTLKPIYVQVNGAPYQVFIGADGKYYLHDPKGQLPFAHTALPIDTSPRDTGLHGLGGNPAAYGQVASAALSFVPVVGPILGPIAGAVSSLFGGGDPTPASSLWSSLINLRQQIAQLTNQLAGATVDTFTVPAGLDPTSDGPNGGNTGNVLAAKITSDVLGLGTTDIHKIKRPQMYQAIQVLQQHLQQLQQQQHDTQLVQQITAAVSPQTVQPAPGAATSQPAPVTGTPQTIPMVPETSILAPQPAIQQVPVYIPQPTTQQMDLTSYLPYIALGGMVLIALLA